MHENDTSIALLTLPKEGNIYFLIAGIGNSEDFMHDVIYVQHIV